MLAGNAVSMQVSAIKQCKTLLCKYSGDTVQWMQGTNAFTYEINILIFT